MKKRRRAKAGKVKIVHIRGVGARCMRTLANGKKRFTKNSACGLRKKGRK